MERVGPISPEKRAELRRQLEGHATLLESQSTVVKIVAKLVGPAVVYIESDVVNPPARKSGRQIEEAGSGVIVELGKKFYVLTNRHVIQGSRPDGIKISLADGRRVYPQKVWDDGESDVAIMLVDAPDLVPATIGDSDRVETGDFVLAVGSPFGLTHSVTFGIISAKGRRDLRFGEATVRFQDFLQTDAAINPGNSGGPLVNLRGEIIGMNTAIASNTGRNEGIGFAIPINMFMYVARQLVEKGTVTRAYIGVSLNARFGPAMAAELGLPALMGSQITAVAKGSPAEAARLAVGDIVLRYNDVAIEDDAHLVNLVSVTDVGAKIPLLVYRDRQTFVTEIVPTERVVSP
jgi:serine protease Do